MSEELKAAAERILHAIRVREDYGGDIRRDAAFEICEWIESLLEPKDAK